MALQLLEYCVYGAAAVEKKKNLVVLQLLKKEFGGVAYVRIGSWLRCAQLLV